MLDKQKIDRLRRIHVIVSMILFFGTLGFCSYMAKDLQITKISLSNFGIYKSIGIFWNTALFLIALQLFHVTRNSIIKHNISKKIKVLFTIATVFLMITAVVTMNYKIHNYTAWLYFILYPISMFLYGYELIKTEFRLGMTSMFLSLTSLLLPAISLFFFSGFAIPEICHTLSIMIWTICVYYEDEYKRLLKWFNF